MTTFVNNRDGGLTNEEGHNRFPLKVWQGNVLEGFTVSQNSPLSMSVLVAAGTAKVNYNDYGYDLKNDTAASVPIVTSDPSNDRIDRIVGYVDRSEPVQDIIPNNPGLLKFMVVPGTPSGSPTRPSDSTVNSAVGSGNPWFDLADVLVGSGVSTISNGNITDTRVPTKIPSGAIDSSIVANAGIWWQQIGRTELSGSSTTIEVPISQPKLYMQARLYIPQQTEGILISLRFNNDSGNNYDYRASNNGAADGVSTANSQLALSTQDWPTARQITMDIFNPSNRIKTVDSSSVDTYATGSPNRRVLAGSWRNASVKINSMTIYRSAGTGQFSSGSTLVVLGHN